MINKVSFPDLSPKNASGPNELSAKRALAQKNLSSSASSSTKTFGEVLTKPVQQKFERSKDQSAKHDSHKDQPKKDVVKVASKDSEQVAPRASTQRSPSSLPNSEKGSAPSMSNDSDTSQENLSEKNQFSDKKPDSALKPISIHKGDKSASNDIDEKENEDSVEDQTAEGGPIAAWMAAHGLNLEMLKAFKAEQTQDKQTAVSDFVAQMQKQFGVSPEQIVKAFQKMDQKDLQLPPEQTAQKFLGNLGLKAEQKPQASILYQNMLQQTEESAVKVKMVDQVIAANSVEKLSGPITKLTQLAEQLTKTSENSSAPVDVMQAIAKLKTADAKAMNPAGNAQMQAPAQPQISAQAAALAAQGQIATGKKDSEQGDDSSVKAAAAPFFVNSMAQAAAGKVQAGEANQVSSRGTSSESLAAMMPGLAAIANRFNQNGKDSGSQKEGSNKDSAASAVFGAKADSTDTAGAKGFAALTQNQAAPGTTAATMANGVAAPQLSVQDRADNLSEIISKANFVTKNGGGEMTVELKGDDMGPMNLKIAIDKGQVSIQMVTQNEKTKKLIEDNLQELKSSLSAHKLHVGDLKVDLADNIQKQMDNQNSQNREQSRDAASQFLSNMHDERDSNRQGFFDASGYQSSRRDPLNRPKMGPATASAAQSLAGMQSKMKHSDSSRRLNLVA